ncbi:HEAT repeat-containing protein [Cardiosporidium cionae]|uniref:HEAT repeat-containing protein n=1 Tax=Cardiosporidium cionae TaxID=476202 RepID=A0ABQ7JDD8_9APIC|nr:HEAT repeat-containing protein [Cardiosporidium cionae]|eukprot:KAF8822042.1 HEAT repeat-containing protein [Cardiosporidium cionae]
MVTQRRMDYPTFLKVLEGFTSPDNPQRNAAVDMFDQFKASQPEIAVQMILQCLKTDAAAELRLQCATLIRNIFRGFFLQKPDDNLWDSLSDPIRRHIKGELLACVNAEQNNLTRTNLCDAISDLALKLVPQAEWTDLNAKLFEMLSSSASSHQKSALKILGQLSMVLYAELSMNSADVAAITARCMCSSDMSVRYECLGFITNIVENGEKKVFRHLMNTVPAIMDTLVSMCEADHENSKQYLHFLVRIAEADSLFFKTDGKIVCQRLCSIIMKESFDEEVRALAVEVLLCIAENKPKLAMKIPGFIDSCVDILMALMLDIRDEKYANWLETGNEVDDSYERFYHIGEEGLDRLAKAFKEEENAKVIEVIFARLGQFLNHSEWYYCFAGIMAISQTAEYLPADQLEEHLENIMSVLLLKLKDDDCRVRFAACEAIGQVSLDHKPFVQETYHKEVLPSLLDAMNDSSARVQSHAMAAFINFTEEVTKSFLQPYVHCLMQQLIPRISLHTPHLVREQAVTAIAVTAAVIEEDFMEFYSTVMPSIMKIVEKCTEKGDRTCRGRAIECISIVGLSVGPERFMLDSQPAMNALLQIARGGFEDDDPVKEFIQLAMGRMCRVMKEQFVPYLPQILPSLLQVLSVQPNEVSEQDAENEDEDMTMVLLSDKAFALKTSLLEDQKRALELIKTFCEVLVEHFQDHIQSCISVILPLLSYLLSDDIKQKALNAMAELIIATRKITEQSKSNKGMLHAMICSTAEHVFKNLDEANSEGDFVEDASIMVAEASGLNECLMGAGPNVLPDAMVKVYVQKVFYLLKQSSERRALCETNRHEPDLDEDDVDLINREDQEEQLLRSTLLEILGTLMKHHTHEFLSTSASICIEFVQKNLEPNCPPEDKALAVYVCDDVFEHCGELGIPLWNGFLSKILDCLNDDDPRVRQAASYGIAQACKIQAFAAYANDAAIRLLAAARKSYHRNCDDNTAAADNAIAALGDCVRLHFMTVEDGMKYLNAWLEYLPLKEDEEEGVRVHGDLMELVMKNDVTVLGEENRNLQRIVEIFVEIYCTDFSESTLDEKIRVLFQQLGESRISSLLPHLSKKQKKQFERIGRDLQRGIQAVS